MQVMCIVIMTMEVRTMCNVLPNNVESRVSIILRHLIKRRETYFTRSVKGDIRII
jgi:hypothetical protein